jgi:hypothetical protein
MLWFNEITGDSLYHSAYIGGHTMLMTKKVKQGLAWEDLG